MSNHLTSLAYKVDAGSLLRKAVLVMLADKASDDGSGIWASKQTMADELCCSKQAVINTLHQFVSEGLLKETGQRKNPNGYTITYSLSVAAMERMARVKKWVDHQSTPLTSQPDVPVNHVDVTSQPGVPKPPLTSLSEAKASSAPAKQNPFPRPEGVDAQVWRDFLTNRKAKRLQNTATAYKRLMDDAARFTNELWPLARLVEHAAAKGWGAIYDPRPPDTGQARRAEPVSFLDHTLRQAGASR